MPKPSPFMRAVATRNEEIVRAAVQNMRMLMEHAMVDSVIMTLGYSNCIHGKNLGTEAIETVIRQLWENYKWYYTAFTDAPDADAVAAKRDELIRKKTTEQEFMTFREFYPMLEHLTLEQEKDLNRARWMREERKKNGR